MDAGCPKCKLELETGIKVNRTSHEVHCPRSRYYVPPSPPAAVAPVPDAASATAGPLSKKRVRSSVDDKEDEEGADIDVNVDDDVIVKKKQRVEGGSDNGNDKTGDDDGDGDYAADDDDDVKRGSAPGDLATRRIGNSIDFPLSNLRPHLICSLCKGYFRDPYTVADCLHTFCRSCLILFFRQGMRCCPTW